MRRLPVPLLVVAALLGGGVLVGSPGPGSTRATTAAARSVPVVGRIDLCPDLRQEAGRVSSRVSVGVLPAGGPDRSGVRAGQVTAGPLAGTSTPPALPLSDPGQVEGNLATTVDADALVVAATGRLAAGLEVEQLTRVASGPGRGLSGMRCVAAGIDRWFLGGSTVPGNAAVLVLANPDDTPAVVDATVWSASGPVDARPGRGLVVPPRGRLVVAMNTLAPNEDLLAVHLSAARGQVAAALRQIRTDGATSQGVEQVPLAPAPSHDVVLPGIPAGPGSRRLVLTAPGSDDATVSVQLTTGDGQFVPTGLDAVNVPAGSSVAVDLTALLAATPAAVRVRADVPVLAVAEVVDGQGSAAQDLSYAGSGSPLDGPALLTGVRLDRTGQSTLLLTAPDADAAVLVTPLAVLGSGAPLPAGRRVVLPGGRTTALALSSLLPEGGSAGFFGVEVAPEPGSGPVLAARYLREQTADGPLTTLLALQAPQQQVRQPTVARDVGLGG